MDVAMKADAASVYTRTETDQRLSGYVQTHNTQFTVITPNQDATVKLLASDENRNAIIYLGTHYPQSTTK